jgi:predicted dehydrogenase
VIGILGSKDDFEQALENPNLEYVVITTPNHLHYEQTKMALEAGKHVLVEKPFTHTFNQALELSELSKHKELKLCVFQNRRFDGDFLAIKKLIEAGKLGEIKYFESHFDRFRPEVDKSKWREQANEDGGVYNDLGPHLVDQAIALFGYPEDYTLDTAQQRVGSQTDDYFHLILKYAKGLRVVLHASCIAKGHWPRFIIHGDQNSIRIDGLDPQEPQIISGKSPLDSDFGIDERKLVFSEGIEMPLEPGNYNGFHQQMYRAIKLNEKTPVSLNDSLELMKILNIKN